VIGDETVAGFLDRVASTSPTPGGGSVGAIAGATGAALISMVVRLTEGREGFEAVAGDLQRIGTSAEEARVVLLSLADLDSAAFDAVMAAFKLPKASDEEKASRSQAIQTAFLGAAQVPLEVARLGSDLVAVAAQVVSIGNPDAASDGLSAAAMCHAAVACALANVEINAASIKDGSVAAGLRSESEMLGARAEEGLASARAAFRQKVGA
jgi:methenyltetrahydrofolate cyclohydrolase